MKKHKIKLNAVKAGKDVKLTLTGGHEGTYSVKLPDYAWVVVVKEMASHAPKSGGLEITGDAACMRALKEANVLAEIYGVDLQVGIKIRRSTLETLDFVLRGVALARGKNLPRSQFLDELISLGMKSMSDE